MKLTLKEFLQAIFIFIIGMGIFYGTIFGFAFLILLTQ